MKSYKYQSPTGSQVSRQRIYQIRHKVAGLCLLCSEPAVDKWYCQVHRDKKRAYNRFKNLESQHRHIALGMCRFCGDIAMPGIKLCQKHRDQNREHVRRNYYKKKLARLAK